MILLAYLVVFAFILVMLAPIVLTVLGHLDTEKDGGQ